MLWWDVLLSGVAVMRSPPEPRQLRDFASVAFWLLIKIVVGFLIGSALFETAGLVVGLVTLMTGG
jgi:hypothetical protein